MDSLRNFQRDQSRAIQSMVRKSSRSFLRFILDEVANVGQISTYSCATIALMNIINNQNDLTCGAELEKFKAITADMTPKERGLKLDDFQFIKDIHNSFSRYTSTQ